MTHDITDFQTDVIEPSRTRPVLVDFWAPWCGPCLALGPVLEKLAAEPEAAFTLAKVNTDEAPALSQRYGVRGIPAVKLFVDGEVVDEFTGALPEYAVRQWLEKALPSENKQRLDQAQTALLAGEDDVAEGLLRQVLATEPENPTAKLLLAQLLVFREPERAAALASGAAFAGPGFVQLEQAIQTLTHLLSRDAEALPEGPGRDAYADALAALQRQDFDAALTRFIDVIRTDRYYDDDGARKACVALFTLLGEQHPVVQKHRPTFNRSLY